MKRSLRSFPSNADFGESHPSRPQPVSVAQGPRVVRAAWLGVGHSSSGVPSVTSFIHHPRSELMRAVPGASERQLAVSLLVMWRARCPAYSITAYSQGLPSERVAGALMIALSRSWSCDPLR